MQSNCEKKSRFSEVNIEDIKSDILKLDKNKTCQHLDIPIKIIKENLEIFADFLRININSCFTSSSFPSCLTMTDVTPLHKKKVRKTLQKTLDQLVSSNINESI